MHTDILTAVLAAVHLGLLLALSSLWCLGLNSLFQENMILEKLGQLFDEMLPAWVNKPLWRCPPCMASFHGTVMYFCVLSSEYDLWLWLPFVVCLAGLNYIIANR